jgi:Fic family protein
LVAQLLEWGRRDRETLPLIKACVVHYELEFIHPFSDGNGRIGRLWQSVILLKASPVFEFAPVESLVHARQADYYRALAKSGRAGDCTAFVVFSLETIRDALADLLREARPEPQTATDRLERARESFVDRWFSRRDYLQLHKRLSTATASRDLKRAVERGIVRRRGSDRTTEYVFVQASYLRP